VIQISPQVRYIEHAQPLPACRSIDLLDALNDVVFGEHWMEALSQGSGLATYGEPFEARPFGLSVTVDRSGFEQGNT
jgi:hypothetical protein